MAGEPEGAHPHGVADRVSGCRARRRRVERGRASGPPAARAGRSAARVSSSSRPTRPASTRSVVTAGEPVLVVPRREVVAGVHALDRVPEHRGVEAARTERPAGEAEHPPFPRVVEDRLVRLDLDRAEALHPAEVVDALHGAIQAHCRRADHLRHHRRRRPDAGRDLLGRRARLEGDRDGRLDRDLRRARARRTSTWSSSACPNPRP